MSRKKKGISITPIANITAKNDIYTILISAALSSDDFTAYGLKIFDSKDFYQQYYRRFALEICAKAASAAQNITVAVIDKKGADTRYPLALALLPYFSTVKVITDHPASYRDIELQAMKEYGATIVFGNESALADCRLVLHLHGDALRAGCIQRNALLISSQPQLTNQSCFVLNGFYLDYPRKMRELCPPDIELSDFCAALWEHNHNKMLDHIPFSAYLSNSRIVNLSSYLDYILKPGGESI